MMDYVFYNKKSVFRTIFQFTYMSVSYFLLEVPVCNTHANDFLGDYFDSKLRDEWNVNCAIPGTRQAKQCLEISVFVSTKV